MYKNFICVTDRKISRAPFLQQIETICALRPKALILREKDLTEAEYTQLVQKVQAYVAPKLFGGATAKTPVEGQGFLKPAEAVTLSRTKVTALGSDWLIEGYPATEGRPLSCLQES